MLNVKKNVVAFVTYANVYVNTYMHTCMHAPSNDSVSLLFVHPTIPNCVAIIA